MINWNLIRTVTVMVEGSTNKDIDFFPHRNEANCFFNINCIMFIFNATQNELDNEHHFFILIM